MGNHRPAPASSSHPAFLSLAALPRPDPSRPARMTALLSVPHASLLPLWEQQLLRIRCSPSRFLLLPLRWSVAQSSLCGGGQIIEVPAD